MSKVIVKSNLLQIDNVQEIKFPCNTFFAESCTIHNNLLYIPLNKSTISSLATINAVDTYKSGLYVYGIKCSDDSQTITYPILEDMLKETKPLFQFKDKEVIVGSKIRGNTWVGCNSAGSLIIYSLDTKLKKEITFKRGYYPNDVCFDTDDDNVVYVISNKNYKRLDGVVSKVSLIDGTVTDVIKNIYSGTGINMKGDDLYISTLVKLYIANKYSYKIRPILSFHEDYPLFDNVTIKDNVAHFAVYSYQCKSEYSFIKNQCLSFLGTSLMSCCCGVGILDRVNIDRTMHQHKVIKFMTYDCDTRQLVYNEFDRVIPEFDETVTQIEKVGEYSYLCTNWKSSKIVIINTLPPKADVGTAEENKEDAEVSAINDNTASINDIDADITV